jgi:mycothiol synthase
VHPDLRHDDARVDPMLAWTAERAAQMVRRLHEKRLYTMWVYEDDTSRTRLLERHGFRRDPDYLMHCLVHPLDMVITPIVPDGFMLRHMNGNGDIASRAAAHRGAFQSGGMTADAYRAFQRAPDYRKELDRIAVAPDGSVASYVMGWLDAQNHVGELEPVGTRPDYQRQGLGRAVVLDALRQLKAQGAGRVFLYVEHHNVAARGLYASVGFRPINRILGYMKPV